MPLQFYKGRQTEAQLQRITKTYCKQLMNGDEFKMQMLKLGFFFIKINKQF